MSNYPLSYYNKILTGSMDSAREVVPLIMDLINPQSVADVGCGSGAWLKVFQEAGVKKILGVEKNLNADKLLISKNFFLDHDLTLPVPTSETFDLAVSLEVGEHLPAQSADQFVESLTKLAPIVVFSAAAPFQGGHRHLNEQWPEYWRDFFRKRNFVVIDALRKRIWNNPKVEWWYAQNILIFAREDILPRYSKLLQERDSTFENQLSLVHPKSLTIHKAIKALPHLLAAAAKRKLQFLWP